MSNNRLDDRFGTAGAGGTDRGGGALAGTDLIQIGELWSAIRQHLRFIACCAFGVGGLVLLATFVLGMKFVSTGQLYLGEVDHRSGGAPAEAHREFDLSGGAEGHVASELEILQSPSLVRRAALESGLNVTIAPAGRGRVSFLRWLVSKRDLSLIDGARDQVLPTQALLGPLVRTPQTYRVLFVDGSRYELWGDSGKLGAGKLEEALTVGDLSLTLMPGIKGRPRAGAEYEIRVDPLDQVLRAVSHVLSVSSPKAPSPGESVNVVKLEYKNASPYLAATFLQKLMDAYLNERQGWKTEDASAAEAFVTNQLRSVRESRDQIQAKLAQFRTNNPVVVLNDEARGMVEQIGRYEEQRAAARLQVAAFADLQKTLSRPNPPIGAYLLGEVNDTVLSNMANSLSQARERLTEFETRFNGLAPEVRDQRAQVTAQLEAIRNYVSSRHRRAQESLGTLNSIIGQFQDKLKTVPVAELGLAQLTRESEVYDRIYSYLLERQQQAGISKASTLSKNRILDMPQVPIWEDSPNLLFRLSSVLIGLFLGVGIVLFRTLFSSIFQGLGDVRRHGGRVPILAAIPMRSGGSWRRRRKQAEEGPIDLATLPADSSFAEGFRSVRAKLDMLDKPAGGRVIVVTSPGDGDGKTTCVWSLASAMASGGRSVLVVDANLRRAVEGSPGAPGLRSVLRGASPWRKAMQPIHQGGSTFYRLSSGGVDRPELLATERMSRLVSEWRDAFEFVLIDCASFPQASDALTLAQMADVTISVIRLGWTRKDLGAEHIAQLAMTGRFYALIVNHVGVERDQAGPAVVPEPLPADSAHGDSHHSASVRLDMNPTIPIHAGFLSVDPSGGRTPVPPSRAKGGGN